ncbi:MULTISPECIES: MFS transporter [Prauserella salsuginis group]|uniref:MFS transporter n=1 Tax=Prauserella salsuginis TaxID=387889 RepID=A0ABW6G075_9PSEU|nr:MULTISPECIES: MFS transporter [Prauserella salsuginis group]MCR3721211.1 putative arabinose efflux permease, MFS family [Prauserella flava]MCR3734708.1 putative arabinose efflux permease, MFS family [Prauserella salsuginis]
MTTSADVDNRFRTLAERRPVPGWLVAVLLGAAWFIVAANIALVPPLVVFMADEMFMSEWQRGAVVAALPLASFAGNLIFGPFVDVIGRRRSVVIGSSVVALLLLGTAMVDSGVLAIGLRVATGLFMPLIGVAVFPCIADYVPQERRMAVTGQVVAGGSLAQLVTVPGALFVAGHLSWRWSFAALALLAAAVAVAVLFAFPAAPRHTNGRANRGLRVLLHAARPGIREPVMAFWLFTFALFTVISFYPSWVLTDTTGATRDVNTVTLVFVAAGVVAVVGASLTGVVAKLPNPWLAALLAVPVPLVLALPLLADSLIAQAMLYASLTFAQALAFPLLRGRANLAAGDDRLSGVNTALNAGYQVAAASAAAVAAPLFGWSPSFVPNTVVAALVFAIVPVVFLLGQRRNPDVKKGEIAP